MPQKNTNVTHSANFRFIMSNQIEEVEFYIQEFNGLGMSLQETNPQAYMGQLIKRPGDTITFNDLQLQVLVDEEYDIVEQLYNWIERTRGISENILDWNYNFTGVLFLKTNRNNIQKKIIFSDCWIRDMGDLIFQANQQDASPIIVPVTIVYNYYKIENV